MPYSDLRAAGGWAKAPEWSETRRDLAGGTERADALSLVERSEHVVALMTPSTTERRLTPGEEWHDMHSLKTSSLSPEVSLS